MNEKAGGLGLINIKVFWTALKFSWLRRLTNISTFWPQVLRSSVSKILGKDVHFQKIVNFDQGKFEFWGKKLLNMF